jgi:magnesium chelatase family protein
MDLMVQVPAAKTSEIVGGSHGEDSATVRARVQKARDRQEGRWRAARSRAVTNATVDARVLRSDDFRLRDQAATTLKQAAEVHGLTGRGVDRVTRIAWTLADLDGADAPDAAHVQSAVMLRSRAQVRS